MDEHTRQLLIELGGDPDYAPFCVGDRVRPRGASDRQFLPIVRIDGGCLFLEEDWRLSACFAEREPQ